MGDAHVRTLIRVARMLERGAGDLSLPQLRVLALVDEGGERASHLADRLAVAKPTITAVVDGLVDRGYVKRTADSDDRRATKITLTAAGRKALYNAEHAMHARLHEVIAHADDPAAVEQALEHLGIALDRARSDRLAGRP
ncbi:MAG: MarR family transcriptional regulator [Acidimicrobiia bacterium]|nr:MarR family transcriptional regulator [Acidimicrobiia bacterium]